MLTFIIPTYKNPNGLLATLLSIKDCSGTTKEDCLHCIVLLDASDPALEHSKLVCETPELAPVTVRYLIFSSPSLTARVNYAGYLCTTPFISVINDDIILGKSDSTLVSKVKPCLDKYLDEIIVLYLCKEKEEDYGYRFPIVSKRFFELVGYLYHPICATQDISERWIGSVFNQLGRIREVKGVDITQNQEYPTYIHFNDEVTREAEYLYSKCTANVRKATAMMLSKFMMKE